MLRTPSMWVVLFRHSLHYAKECQADECLPKLCVLLMRCVCSILGGSCDPMCDQFILHNTICGLQDCS